LKPERVKVEVKTARFPAFSMKNEENKEKKRGKKRM
jgi:hypothetical protein